MVYGSYGAIHAIEVDGSTICDTDHIVGFTDGLTYNIEKFGGYKSFFLSGEGLVCRFQGRGTLLLQTRNPKSLVSFLHPFRPIKAKNNDD